VRGMEGSMERDRGERGFWVGVRGREVLGLLMGRSGSNRFHPGILLDSVVWKAKGDLNQDTPVGSLIYPAEIDLLLKTTRLIRFLSRCSDLAKSNHTRADAMDFLDRPRNLWGIDNLSRDDVLAIYIQLGRMDTGNSCSSGIGLSLWTLLLIYIRCRGLKYVTPVLLFFFKG